jgi:threonine dehydratase
VELVDRWVDEMVTVDEDGIAEAMILLAERAKLVVEGAGAAPVGALLTGALKPAASGTTLLILSGGNVDAHVLASVIDRHQTGIGRRTRILTRIGDHPGSLAALLNAVAAEGGNILDLVHVRDGMPRALGETGIELVIENRDADHMAGLLAGMRRAGYSVNKLD